uniref:Uncharacterized protein n=1 Tax=Arundo donax TaxID=35708 RepID=A0A0A8ZL15_ARUDO
MVTDVKVVLAWSCFMGVMQHLLVCENNKSLNQKHILKFQTML